MKKRALIKQLRLIAREAGVELVFIRQGGNQRNLEDFGPAARDTTTQRHQRAHGGGIVRRVEGVKSR